MSDANTVDADVPDNGLAMTVGRGSLAYACPDGVMVIPVALLGA